MTEATTTADPAAKPENYRAFIDLLDDHPGLAAALHALAGRHQGSVVDGLREAEATAEPGQIDAALRTIIRTAQQARKLLAAGKA